jgi:hypothetical protein
MKAPITLFSLLVIMAASCKKSGTDDSQTSVEKYMSPTAGNSWTYETVNNTTVSTTTNTVTCSNKDTVIGSRTYRVFKNSAGAANDYYNISGNDYYTFRNLVAFGSSSVESIYLKDNAAVGTSWSQIVTIAPFSGVPTTIPLTVAYSITEKGISRTVNGENYNNVIHTTTTLSSTSLPAGSITTDIHSYYAPKYGLIESKYKISTTLLTGSNVDQTTTLKSTNF